MRQVAFSDSSQRKALVCVGSNVTSHWGSPLETVERAGDEITKRIRRELRKSRYFQTPAFPAGSGDDFVNAAFAFETEMSAENLLSTLHDIEAAADRTRDVRWGARTLDLDLIALGDEIRPDAEAWQRWAKMDLAAQMAEAPDQLILPHPRVQDRAFALVPLCDVAEDWLHPVLNRTIGELTAALPKADLEAVVALD